MSASKIALETTALRDKPDGLIRELYAADAPLHAAGSDGLTTPSTTPPATWSGSLTYW